jgi:sRNA-binding carbon storage regulator CsrA
MIWLTAMLILQRLAGESIRIGEGILTVERINCIERTVSFAWQPQRNVVRKIDLAVWQSFAVNEEVEVVCVNMPPGQYGTTTKVAVGVNHPVQVPVSRLETFDAVRQIYEADGQT